MGLNTSDWLKELNLAQYAQAFADNHIDQDLLLELSEDDLEKLGVTSLGHRKRLLREIEQLRSDLLSEIQSAPTEQSVSLPISGTDAERRQLTIFFCDLVRSTELSHRLDPEDYRELLWRYQDAVSAAATRYGGHVARYLGDGVLVYFGWPHAHEDQAERAIWAGLEALGSVEGIQLDDNPSLSARVGIASGEVVIGDLVGERGRDVDAVTGPTPSLAARLQALAETNQVVIDAETRTLVGTAFDLEDGGSHDLKGFPHPVRVWKVVGKGQADSRFQAIHFDRLTRFVGRRHERGLIRERWALARSGAGQAVLLRGEAGIGKSRISQEFRDSINNEWHFCFLYQCSSYHKNSAFHPVIQHLERAAGFNDGDDAETRLDKLEAVLRLASKDVEATAPLFAALLSLSSEQRYGALTLSPQQQRDRIIEALISQVVALSQQRPVLCLLEDAHWIDPTTEALIGETIVRIANARILMLITCRPDYTPRWSELPNLSTINLSRLSTDQAMEIVKAVGGENLTPESVAEIISRADGVPLFVEELTKSLLEVDQKIADIPKSLQASLIGRLDRLGDAGKLASLAATLGKTFQYDFLRKVSDLNQAELDQALNAMTAAGLLLRHGRPTQAAYTFRHTLLQDAAYESLLKSKKQQYHGKVADVLLSDLSHEAVTEPELVARHLSLAGRPATAVDFWLRAGQRAGARSAHFEAIASLENGLKDLELLPTSESRDQKEFELRIALGASLLAVKGWSAANVEENYERAHELSATTSDVRKSFSALRGLFNVFLLKGEVNNGRKLANKLLDIAISEDDKALLLEGYRTVGMCDFFIGNFVKSHKNLRRCNSIYDKGLHHSHAFVYGTDPAVVGYSISSWVNWILGNLAEAESDIETALSLARELGHPFSLAYAHGLAASVNQFSRNPEAAKKNAEEALAIAQQNDYPYWVAWAAVVRGWALAALGDPERGILELNQGLKIYESTEAMVIRPYIMTLKSEIFAWAELPQRGLEALEQALGSGNKTDVRFYEAESLRLQGELLRRSCAGDGRKSFHDALAMARRQRARGFELRAAVSVARAMLEEGDLATAQTLLSDIYQTFDANHLIGKDLQDAREILSL